MGEEVRMSDCHEEEEDDTNNDGGEGEEDDEEEDRVIEWEFGLPSSDNLMPLSQGLIPPELASAFSILPEPLRTLVEVNRASRTTFSGLHPGSASSLGFSTNNNYKPFVEDRRDEGMDLDGDDDDRWDSRRSRKIDSPEEADSALRTDNSVADDPSTRALKRPRLVWTPQLHKRFVDVVAHLGLKNAVPKTIIQLMNVEGLTRENVASHLQKYRLYVKRMHGLSNGLPPPSSSDQLFLSTPVPHSLREAVRGSGPHVNGRASVAIAMPYGSPPLHMMPMPVYGMGNGFGHMGMQMGIPGGFDPNQYAAQQRDWSGNKFGSAVPYPRPASNEN